MEFSFFLFLFFYEVLRNRDKKINSPILIMSGINPYRDRASVALGETMETDTGVIPVLDARVGNTYGYVPQGWESLRKVPFCYFPAPNSLPLIKNIPRNNVQILS